ncbi:hypothetical protein [Streptomyces rhizosphaericus]|uniref:hypothetical protein n=1 Tax=Streptomyces rhizosphaericus TaxID=114699 RepID=UPI0011802A60|nr:hypothetical protein [Streptomyces rhizosphaericus]
MRTWEPAAQDVLNGLGGKELGDRRQIYLDRIRQLSEGRIDPADMPVIARRPGCPDFSDGWREIRLDPDVPDDSWRILFQIRPLRRDPNPPGPVPRTQQAVVGAVGDASQGEVYRTLGSRLNPPRFWSYELAHHPYVLTQLQELNRYEQNIVVHRLGLLERGTVHGDLLDPNKNADRPELHSCYEIPFGEKEDDPQDETLLRQGRRGGSYHSASRSPATPPARTPPNRIIYRILPPLPGSTSQRIQVLAVGPAQKARVYENAARSLRTPIHGPEKRLPQPAAVNRPDPLDPAQRNAQQHAAAQHVRR